MSRPALHSFPRPSIAHPIAALVWWGIALDTVLLIHALWWIESLDLLWLLIPVLWIGLAAGYLYLLQRVIRSFVQSFAWNHAGLLAAHLGCLLVAVVVVQSHTDLQWKWQRERSMLEELVRQPVAQLHAQGSDEIFIDATPDQQVIGVWRAHGFLERSGFFFTSNQAPPRRCADDTQWYIHDVIPVNRQWYWVSCRFD